MGAKYETWLKKNLGFAKGLPESTHYTIDMAIETAKKLSIGDEETEVWDDKHSGMIKVRIPNMCAVIRRDGTSDTRGWGIGGVWKPVVKDCKRCNNTGLAQGNYWTSELCLACGGASFCPKI